MPQDLQYYTFGKRDASALLPAVVKEKIPNPFKVRYVTKKLFKIKKKPNFKKRLKLKLKMKKNIYKNFTKAYLNHSSIFTPRMGEAQYLILAF